MFSWLRRSKEPADAGRLTRSERKAVAVELAEWAAARRGVEVFVEPKTAVTGTSVVLVAHDGEFRRRRMASPKAAQAFAHDNRLPIYDATLIGYPQRMRDYSRRQTILAQRAEKDALGG
ncbi:MAG: oxidoreductase [Nakamurella sp.]